MDDAGVRPFRVQVPQADPGELPEEAVDRDQLLADVTLYWLTGTAGSSAALYYETAHAGDGWAAVAGRPSETPAGRRCSPAAPPCPFAIWPSETTGSCTGRS